MPAADLEDYLTRNVAYDMSDLHLEGLDEFYRLAAEAGLASPLQPMRFPAGHGVIKMRAPA